MSTAPFSCDKCGACCTLAGMIPELRAMALPNGQCVHLADDCTCEIYDSRPDICRVDRMWKKKGGSAYMPWEEYCKRSEDACRIIKQATSQLCAALGASSIYR